MGNPLMLDVGQAEKLKLAFRRNGWTKVKIDKLCEGEILKDVLAVIDGFAEIKTVRYVIDLGVNPFVPDNWKIEEHKKTGTFEWDPTKVQLYLSKQQIRGKVIDGNAIRKELVGKSVFNACLLDYLLAHPHIIPNAWKWKYVFFWGTIYRRIDGTLCVRCLCWRDGLWQSGSVMIDDDWSDDCLAALRVSA